MNWTFLESSAQITDIKNKAGYSLIFKHSTRCSISMMAKKRVEMDTDEVPSEVTPFFLDLIAHRDLSNQIAEVFQVHHESPQLLLIKDGECILDQSHGDISIEEAVGLV